MFRDSSVFNHGEEPNVARWHCGDIVCFRTNRAVEAGEALTVSYVASPLLPDPAAARGALAHFDFVADGEEASPTVDAEAQAQLMMLSPSERLATIAQAEAAASLFADRLELTIQKAAALQASGDAGGAAEAWLAAVLTAASSGCRRTTSRSRRSASSARRPWPTRTGWRRPERSSRPPTRLTPQSRSGPVLDYSRGATNATCYLRKHRKTGNTNHLIITTRSGPLPLIWDRWKSRERPSYW